MLQMVNRPATKIASPLSRKAVLASVNISVWTARKRDKKATKEVHDKHGASDDAGNYNKLLIERKRMEKIGSIVSKARTFHDTMTKPWSSGIGILPNTLHAKYTDQIRVLKRDFNEVVEEFVREYESFVAERKAKLRGLFNPADYPHPSQIRSKFSFDVLFLPVPDVDDFRSDVLDADTIEDIKRELVESSETVLQNATKDTAKQIVEVVGHMSKKLAEYKTKKGEGKWFSDTLVGNVRELAELLPAFNLNDDPELARLIERITKELCVEDAQTLRDNDRARRAVRKSADSILEDVSKLLG